MYQPFPLEIQTGLLWAAKRQFVSPNALHNLKQYWPFVHTQSLLVEIEVRVLNHLKDKKHEKQRCWGLSRHGHEKYMTRTYPL